MKTIISFFLLALSLTVFANPLEESSNWRCKGKIDLAVVKGLKLKFSIVNVGDSTFLVKGTMAANHEKRPFELNATSSCDEKFCTLKTEPIVNPMDLSANIFFTKFNKNLPKQDVEIFHETVREGDVFINSAGTIHCTL